MPACFYMDYCPSKREYQFRAIVRKQMIADGWHPKALKFDSVCNRRAKQMMRT